MSVSCFTSSLIFLPFLSTTTRSTCQDPTCRRAWRPRPRTLHALPVIGSSPSAGRPLTVCYRVAIRGIWTNARGPEPKSIFDVSRYLRHAWRWRSAKTKNSRRTFTLRQMESNVLSCLGRSETKPSNIMSRLWKLARFGSSSIASRIARSGDEALIGHRQIATVGHECRVWTVSRRITTSVDHSGGVVTEPRPGVDDKLSFSREAPEPSRHLAIHVSGGCVTEREEAPLRRPSRPVWDSGNGAGRRGNRTSADRARGIPRRAHSSSEPVVCRAGIEQSQKPHQRRPVIMRRRTGFQSQQVPW